jgi:hypothetical protein
MAGAGMDDRAGNVHDWMLLVPVPIRDLAILVNQAA